MINKTDFVDFLYNKLPAIYRYEDSKIGLPLYRYLQSMCEGGFNPVIENSNNFLTLVDPETCPEEFFPYLYESFGLPYFDDIPVEYHRRFLKNIGALLKRRGTNTAVRYLVSTLTGFNVDLFYERRYNEEGKCTGRYLDIVLLLDHLTDIDPNVKVVERFVKIQLPFYLIPLIIASVSPPDLNAKIYSGCRITYSQSTDIIPFEKEKHTSIDLTHNKEGLVGMTHYQDISKIQNKEVD